MRVYLVAFLISAIISIIFGTGWYAVFGYASSKTLLDNIALIYTNYSFWLGALIWTFLYFLLFALPVVIFKKYKEKAIK